MLSGSRQYASAVQHGEVAAGEGEPQLSQSQAPAQATAEEEEEAVRPQAQALGTRGDIRQLVQQQAR